ncbi:hypothetical protein HPB48_003172 [Haemaphysalis longicornis]|uniref:Peptidase M13 N-terminal domain-containing protein n=1 Tax=Haemaphysalis longicornis TaxID=44386 RepID=A0A9J6H1J7_HAELO|nr:hypothetical protein HPB48_003172 [Haemaphysalis longicornis]
MPHATFHAQPPKDGPSPSAKATRRPRHPPKPAAIAVPRLSPNPLAQVPSSHTGSVRAAFPAHRDAGDHGKTRCDPAGVRKSLASAPAATSTAAGPFHFAQTAVRTELGETTPAPAATAPTACCPRGPPSADGTPSPPATGHLRHGFGVVVVAFVLLCSGAISAYYVWYSHEEFAKHRTTGRQRFSKEQQFSEAELEPQAPLLVAPVTPEEARQPPPAAASPTETASTRRREMYFGTPLGHRRALKLRPDEATPELASRRRRCMTRFCQERTDAVLNALNWSVDPCTDFEAFACSRWQAPAPAEVVLAEQLERELYLSLSSKLKPEVWRVEGLLEECLRSPLPQTSRLQLRSLLRDLGLYGWPFRADTQSRGDVWKAAALLFRQLALTPLVGLAIAPHPRNASQPLVALDEPTLLVDAKHALDTAFKHFTPGRYVELAEHVGDFSSRLSQITTGKRAATLSSLRSHGSFGPFLALALGDLVRLQERSPLLLRCERFVRALKALLHATRNRDLLNYLGFRALVHVSPLLTEESRPLATARMFQLTGRRRYGWPRWRRCVRLAERTAPRAAVLDRLVGLKLARDLAAAVNESLGNFTWLADADRRNARTLLAALDVQVFYPSWIGNSTLREAYDGLFPEVTRGNVLQTYRDFVPRVEQQRRRSGAPGSPGRSAGGPLALVALDVHAGLDADALRIYVPPALVNGSTRGGDAWLAAQLPAQGPRLAQALIEALHERAHPPARYHWSLNSSASQLERCLEPTGGLVMQLSLEPARNLFGRYVTSVQGPGHAGRRLPVAREPHLGAPLLRPVRPGQLRPLPGRRGAGERPHQCHTAREPTVCRGLGLPTAERHVAEAAVPAAHCCCLTPLTGLGTHTHARLY